MALLNSKFSIPFSQTFLNLQEILNISCTPPQAGAYKSCSLLQMKHNLKEKQITVTSSRIQPMISEFQLLELNMTMSLKNKEISFFNQFSMSS